VPLVESTPNYNAADVVEAEDAGDGDTDPILEGRRDAAE